MKFWYQKAGWRSYMLWPLACIYQLVVVIRRYAYRLGWLSQTRLPLPVIVVGNLSVGGTGKTPLVIALALWLQQHDVNVGIICRGYGGKVSSQPKLITAASDPASVGDEALLLAQATPCVVAACSDRVRAVRYLLEQHAVDCVLSDDGLQHLALGRDLEINVIDALRGYGNGYCLPAGPLREPIATAQQVDLWVYHTVKDASDARYATNSIPSYAMQLQPASLQPVGAFAATPAAAPTAGQRVHAVAAIGNPQRFFATLRGLGFELIEHTFPDHHSYTAKELIFADGLPIVMTAKDAVKCQNFQLQNAWYLPVSAQLSPEFWQAVATLLRQLPVVRQGGVQALQQLATKSDHSS